MPGADGLLIQNRARMSSYRPRDTTSSKKSAIRQNRAAHGHPKVLSIFCMKRGAIKNSTYILQPEDTDMNLLIETFTKLLEIDVRDQTSEYGIYDLNGKHMTKVDDIFGHSANTFVVSTNKVDNEKVEDPADIDPMMTLSDNLIQRPSSSAAEKTSKMDNVKPKLASNTKLPNWVVGQSKLFEKKETRSSKKLEAIAKNRRKLSDVSKKKREANNNETVTTPKVNLTGNTVADAQNPENNLRKAGTAKTPPKSKVQKMKKVAKEADPDPSLSTKAPENESSGPGISKTFDEKPSAPQKLEYTDNNSNMSEAPLEDPKPPNKDIELSFLDKMGQGNPHPKNNSNRDNILFGNNTAFEKNERKSNAAPDGIRKNVNRPSSAINSWMIPLD